MEQNLSPKEALIAAIDVANESFRKHPPKGWSDDTLLNAVNFQESWKQGVIASKNKTHIKEYSAMLFTYFQEGGGEAVEYFWSKLKEQNLPFKRENKMAKILKRKKIKDRGEYDFVIDTMIPYLQEGFITDDDVKALNIMIGKYEDKKKTGLRTNFYEILAHDFPTTFNNFPTICQNPHSPPLLSCQIILYFTRLLNFSLSISISQYV